MLVSFRLCQWDGILHSGELTTWELIDKVGNDQVGVDLMGTNPRSVSFVHRRLNMLGKYIFYDIL